MFCRAAIKQKFLMISFVDGSYDVMCMDDTNDEKNEDFLKFIFRDFSDFLEDDRTIFDFTRGNLMEGFQRDRENYSEFYNIKPCD